MKAFKVAPHAAWRRVEGEIVILDLNTSLYYSLNEVGARIWELLASGMSPHDAAERIFEEYETERGTARRDVEKLILELTKDKLLVPA